MKWFLFKNYFKLSKFMNITLFPNWKVDYKITYNNLTDEQKKLSDKFTTLLKQLDKL